MQDGLTQKVPLRGFGFATNLAVILGAFCLLILASLPNLLSFEWWVFGDRSAFLNVDYLYFTKHYRLGVDVCYSYGLLPVLLQHLVVVPFGRSFRPMIGCTLVVMIFFAIFWASLLEHLPRQRRWLFAVAGLSQILVLVNPNFPYSLVQLSILYALLFVLKGRYDIALAISAIGCFCVPSLPLVLTLLLGFTVIGSWWLTPNRSFARLIALLAPGVLTYAGMATLLGLVFGFKSIASTMLPFAGASFYKTSRYTGLDAFSGFLHPPGYGLKYYIEYYPGSPVTWFVLCTLFLFILSIFVLSPLLKGRWPSPSASVVVLVAILQFVFIFFVYGIRGQHSIYEPVLAAATLVGISILPQPKYRDRALLLYIFLGVLGQTGAVYKTMISWRTTAPEPNTFGLYSDPGFARDWSTVVSNSQRRKTFMVGYATGHHLYFPSIEDADAWFMDSGLLLPSQKEAILNQMKQAEIVVEFRSNPVQIANNDQDIQAELATMHLTKDTEFLHVWEREDKLKPLAAVHAH